MRRKSQQGTHVFDSLSFLPGGVAGRTGAACRIANTRKRSNSRKSLVVGTWMGSRDSYTSVRARRTRRTLLELKLGLVHLLRCVVGVAIDVFEVCLRFVLVENKATNKVRS